MIEEASTLGRQALKSKKTREKIINAVVSLIKEGGFSAASTSRIAERAGMTWGAAQHHFGSKEEILEAVMVISHEKFTALMGSEALRKGTVADRVDAFVDRMWEHYQDDLYLAALEILLATRGSEAKTGSTVLLEFQSREHLKTLRGIFHDSHLNDEQMLDALIFAHCFLTGLSIDKIIEKNVQHAEVHIRRLKVVLLGLLNFG